MPTCNVCGALYPTYERRYRRGRTVEVKIKCPYSKKHKARKKGKDEDWLDEALHHKLIKRIARERKKIRTRRGRRERKRCAF